AAALIALGFNIAGVVKALGMVATLCGWWGWARLASRFLGESLNRGWLWRTVACGIAIISTLLCTPPWNGTDIVLWAALPWMLEWVVKADDENTFPRRWFDTLTGALCGLC